MGSVAFPSSLSVLTHLGALHAYSRLLCPPEYDVEAAQEKDRQAFKPTDILRTQKTNCDGYAGLFERMCRYERQPEISKSPRAVTRLPPSFFSSRPSVPLPPCQVWSLSLQTLPGNPSES